jgi:hypothetical protein
MIRLLNTESLFMKRSILAWLGLAIGMALLACLPTLASAAADPSAKEPVSEAAEDASADDKATDSEKPVADAKAKDAASTDAAANEPAAESGAEDAANPKPLPKRSPYRPLAPWVMKTVDPMRSLGETVSHHDIIEVLAVDPKLAWAKDAYFRHDVWTLDFKFKPVRMISVDEPHAGGHMERKLIWYMVYSVTNTGKVYHPTEDVDLKYETAQKSRIYQVTPVDQPIRFLPEFVLDTFQRGRKGTLTNKQYPDRVIPVAMAAIRLREDPNRQFLNTVEMARAIKVGETLWGIATWEDIDLATFKFSVVISGLTNAYRWEDVPDAYKAGDPPMTGRKREQRMLKLNFWRPADKYFEHEEEIRYGVPGGVDYEWVYR